MGIEITKYIRKSFAVEAVRVDKDNMDEVSEWCEGHIDKDKSARLFIKIDVSMARYGRQTQAYVGDWVLRMGTGFRVYTHSAFEKSFDVESFEESE